MGDGLKTGADVLVDEGVPCLEGVQSSQQDNHFFSNGATVGGSQRGV